MRIAVCIKHVPDTEANIRISADGRSIEQKDVNFVASPFDDYALEEALRIREKAGVGEVVLLSAGPAEAAKTLRTGLAMGADRAVHVRLEGFPEPGPPLTAGILVAALRKIGPDLVLCGKKGVGGDHGQVHSIIAEGLDWPQATAIVKLELGDGTFRAEREIEGATEVLEGRLPAVFSAEKGLNEPRYPSLKGIMAAKKKPIEEWTPEGLGFGPGDLGDEASRVVVIRLDQPPERPQGRMITGEPPEAVRELVRLLRDEEKLI